MKLAEALIQRADYQKRVAEINIRLERNAKVQEGTAPAMDPMALLDEQDKVIDALQILIQRINATNARTAFDEIMTIADALAVRDMLRERQCAVRKLVSNAYVTQSHFGLNEVKFVPAVNIAVMQKRVDDLAAEYRKLDTRIQGINWLIELDEG